MAALPHPGWASSPFNVNWDLGPAAGWVLAASPLFYLLLRAQLSFLSACWLAASARQQEGTGWSQRTAALGPEARVLTEAGRGQVPRPDHTLPIATTPCPLHSVQVQELECEVLALTLAWHGSHQEPSASPLLSQGGLCIW